MRLTLVSFAALRWFAVLAAALLVVAPSAAQPATTPPTTQVSTYKTAADIPASEFFRLPSYSQMSMSPDGKKLAALAPAKGRENLVVIDLETRQSTATTSFNSVDVNWFTWVDSTRLIFSASNRELGTGVGRRGAMIAIDIDGQNSRNMAERRFVMYKARDGLNIPAWLTVPRGVETKNLPLIVHIHGGPWARSYQGAQWGRWPDAQFFASRGYAVLEPEPRGSTGFGAKHYQMSFMQWGLSMQDDITDGALHLASSGIVDKSRMCLFGGSYGGYATLQGLVKDPDLWKCGHAYVAVTDIELKQNVTWSDTARYSDYYQTDFKRWIGDISTDRARFDATSPAKNASKIKAAVMLTMGGQDQRVPIIHGTTMRDAMEKAGKPLDYTVYSEEGHGFNAPANVVDFHTRTERFFAKYLK